MLRGPGERGFEALVVWAGRWLDAEAGVFIVAAALMPPQSGIRTDDGVAVTVDADALFDLNASLNSHELRLVAQLHTHPGEAYHSETDDRFAVVTARGGISIVVPDFAARPIEIGSCAVYRLQAGGSWIELTTKESVSLIEILDD